MAQEPGPAVAQQFLDCPGVSRPGAARQLLDRRRGCIDWIHGVDLAKSFSCY
jgi:hypothetical protein